MSQTRRLRAALTGSPEGRTSDPAQPTGAIRDIENSDHRDIMSLAGLLSTLDDDPQLRDVISRAEYEPIPPDARAVDPLTGEDLVAPAALRPVLIAALATGPAGSPWRSPPPPARPTTWSTRSARSCRRTAWRASPAGRRCRTSGCRRARTRSGSGSPCCGGWPTRPATAIRTGRWRSWSRRSAACCSRSWPGSATSSRSQLAAGDALRARRPAHQAGRDRLRAGQPGHRARRDRRPRRHRRRVPADRGAPAPGGVLRRHGGGDPLLQGGRPAQHRPTPTAGCGRRRAANCC